MNIRNLLRSRKTKQRRKQLNRRRPALEFLEDRIVLDGTHEADILTFVIDFKEPAQGTTTAADGTQVGAFDPTDYNLAASDFDAVAQETLRILDMMFFDLPTAPVTAIPDNHDLRMDLVLGDVGVAPAGVSEYYTIQVGNGLNGFTGGVAYSIGAVRDANGNGPNIGPTVGDPLTVGSVDAATPSTIPGIPLGNITVTAHALSLIIAHEIGHTLSLEHISADPANTTVPDNKLPIMATPAIDAPLPDQLLDPPGASFSLVGTCQGAGCGPSPAGTTFRHIDQLAGAVGTHLALENTVEGTVFLDVNEDGVQDAGEAGLANIDVFFDLDLNGQLDAGEPVTTTDVDGNYQLIGPGLGLGTFSVVVDVPPGFLPTVPEDGAQSVTFNDPSDRFLDVDFGLAEDPAQISGFKWIDSDLDGRYDSDTEVPGAGFRIYLDLNDNGRMDINEPTTLTDSDGNYSILSPGPGTYVVREALPPGHTLTFPSNGFHTVELAQDEGATGLNFGNSGLAHDFGNAPPSYGTLLADDGARHRILPGFQMGATMSGEMDAVDGIGDNDGTQFGRMVAGLTGELSVNVRLNGQTPGYVNAWVDFDGSGTFDADEQVIANDRRLEGDHTISFDVPADAVTGETWARVRYGFEFNMGPIGEAFAGEVEDSLVNVVGDEPQAVDDLFEGPDAVDQDSSNNSLDVLANDFASTAGPITVSLVQGVTGPAATTQGGIVAVAGDDLSVIYTPPTGFFGTDTFTYTITDPLGSTSTANVEVVVTPTIAGPIALDDVHFFPDFGINQSTDIPVLINDFIGPNGPVRINQVTQQGAFGTAVVNGSVLTYTPTNANSEGRSDLITYEIIDQANQVSEANVLIQIGDTTIDDGIQITLGAFDPVTGNPINTVAVGDVFELRGFVADIRDPIPPGPNGQDLNGVFSSYFDVSVNKTDIDSLNYKASFLGQPTMTANYPEAFNGDTLTPGLVNEAGGVQPIQIDGQVQGHGLGPIHIWTQTVRANDPGNLIFQPNPSDDDDLLTTFFDPPDEALLNQISFIPTSLIVTAPGGEGEGFHNLDMAGDVDGNGRVDARDPLLIINKYVYRNAEGEGNQVMWDVINDGKFRIDDVLATISYFRDAHNARNSGNGPVAYAIPNSLGSDGVLAEGVLVDDTLENPVQRQRNDDGQVVRREASDDSATQYRAEGEGSTTSVYDREWKVDLESSLDDDLLETISSNWESED